MTKETKEAYQQLLEEIRDLRDDGWDCREVVAELYPQDMASRGFLLTKGDDEIRIQLP